MGYIFDPLVLQAVAKEGIAKKLKTKDLFAYIAEKLAEKYPGHIDVNAAAVFNNAGGAMGTMYVLHASITEYVIIFGSPIGTEGHTGRFMADDYFTILEGEQWAFGESDTERSVFRPGDMHHLPRGTAKAYRIPDHCFALEYARGFIPAMLPFGFADTFFSTLDFNTLGRTVAIYAKRTIAELLQGKI
ncbi:C-8 sterol isomerase erg-1 [Capsaspora owczarzaki ATCC 30864]|uniref:C-8 sterol isomerase erg-1 n=1 Tax=Capsaspora owczarzaki (strain ATCC 30864) TaxID=595528 RepID=A0A0D2X317_CAPO3|nr:C-8 sterol isomerase erg-1 [Capsaspora owczarzaki ATCC 30864]KJE93529.1 C-8 sterol isomerase erg-1 [Capsaspora owczarzaki ATCC 30864]|eukprot:XP_004348130.1 C-8 sterol isomerase erg-1 [Capsaspora owczarzaki ATCC 30864]